MTLLVDKNTNIFVIILLFLQFKNNRFYIVD